MEARFKCIKWRVICVFDTLTQGKGNTFSHCFFSLTQ